MLEHQADVDALWDAIRSLDEHDGLSAWELSVLLGEVARASLELEAVVGRLAADAAKQGDAEDAASA